MSSVECDEARRPHWTLDAQHSTHCIHRLPRYDDLLDLFVSTEQLRVASVQFRYAIRRTGEAEVLVEGFTKHACLDADGKVVRFPESLLSILQRKAYGESHD